MLIVTINRAELAEHLPNSFNVAEVGVFRGGFASLISKRINPNRLHLIDPWGKDPEDEYISSYRVTDDMEKMYKSVNEMFKDKIDSGNVIVHREYSTRVAPSFDDNYFDWINIDGMHSYETVLSDLKCFSGKVRKNGFIMGHDFTNSRMGRIKNFGVIQAVTEFCRPGEWKIILITNEDAPSYLLTRAENEEGIRRVVESIGRDPKACIFNIDESLLHLFEQVELFHQDGKRKQMISFMASSQIRTEYE